MKDPFYKKIMNLLIILLLKIWGLMSFAMAQYVGWIIGSILSFFNTNITQVINTNIKLCFPKLSNSHRKKLIRNSVRQACITGSEIPAILFKSPKKLLNKINKIYGEDILQTSYKKGRGVMVLGPHLGCWEIGAMYYSKDYPTAMLYTPPKIKILDKLIYKARSRLYSKMAPASHIGVKILLKAIKDKKIVAMLTDQVPAGNAGSYINFFNIPAKTMTFPR